jgi:hypothetical protein
MCLYCELHPTASPSTTPASPARGSTAPASPGLHDERWTSELLLASDDLLNVPQEYKVGAYGDDEVLGQHHNSH